MFLTLIFTTFLEWQHCGCRQKRHYGLVIGGNRKVSVVMDCPVCLCTSVWVVISHCTVYKKLSYVHWEACTQNPSVFIITACESIITSREKVELKKVCDMEGWQNKKPYSSPPNTNLKQYIDYSSTREFQDPLQHTAAHQHNTKNRHNEASRRINSPLPPR